jgi:NADH:ubiquinone oxidoreductase subunit K
MELSRMALGRIILIRIYLFRITLIGYITLDNITVKRHYSEILINVVMLDVVVPVSSVHRMGWQARLGIWA